jgi:hypothetical protein
MNIAIHRGHYILVLNGMVKEKALSLEQVSMIGKLVVMAES